MSLQRLFGSPVLRTRHLLAAAALGLLLTPALVAGDPCVQPDAGGTVSLPPNGCGYLSPADVHMIIDGLPPGTTIIVGATHQKFFNITHMPGGSLGGEIEQFNSFLGLHLQGTGSLSTYDRSIGMQAQCETHTAPRSIGADVQSFDTEMFKIQGQLPAGDPDFDLLRITAGTSFGMPSPGHTTLTRVPGTANWNVDSFFDITYIIEFTGHPGGPFGGMHGSTTGTIRMHAGEPAPVPPCTIVDNGTGTVDLPPDGCGYVSPSDLHKMIDGLPPGTTVNISAKHDRFFNVNRTPDPAGGEVEQFISPLQLKLTGTGELGTYQRTLSMQTQVQIHTDPRTPGTSPQSFDTEMLAVQGQLPPGDPDFDLLRITGGTNFGMPSPGHTTLTLNGGTLAGPGATWDVRSFFDITYKIEFVGSPSGPFAGRSGSTTATIRMGTGTLTVGVPELQPQGPRRLKLVNRPNPFNTGTTFEYRLENPAKIHLAIYDAAGHRVRGLTDSEMPAGPHAVYWDARNDSGRKVGAGTYFVKISVNGKVAGSSKATIIK